MYIFVFLFFPCQKISSSLFIIINFVFLSHIYNKLIGIYPKCHKLKNIFKITLIRTDQKVRTEDQLTWVRAAIRLIKNLKFKRDKNMSSLMKIWKIGHNGLLKKKINRQLYRNYKLSKRLMMSSYKKLLNMKKI